MNKEQTIIKLISPLGEVMQLKNFEGVSISRGVSNKVSSFSVKTGFFDETEMKKFSVGSTVEIYLNYFGKEEKEKMIFKGVISEIPKSLNAIQKNYDISGFDKLFLTQRILINESYENKKIEEILRDLIARYAVPNGLKLGTIESIPYDITIAFKDVHLFTALEKLCDAIGYSFSVDFEDKLNVYSIKDKLSNIPIKIDDYFKNTANFSLDSSNLVNSLRIYGGSSLSRDITQFITTDGQNAAFLLNYKPRAASSGSVEVSVNGVPQSVGIKGMTESNVDVLIDFNEKNINFVYKEAVYSTDAETGEQITTKEAGEDKILAAGDVIKIVYRYETPILADLADDSSIAVFGLYQDTLDAPEITDKSALFDKARQHLDKYSKPIITGGLDTWKNDHEAGEIVKVQIKTEEGYFIDELLQITEKQIDLVPNQIKISYKFEQKKQLNQIIKDMMARLDELEKNEGSEEVQKLNSFRDEIQPISAASVSFHTHTGFIVGKGFIGASRL